MKRIQGRYFVFHICVLGLGSMLTSCTRSPRFHQEQQYYQSDSQFEASRGEEQLARTEKFGTPKRRIYVMPFENTTPFNKPAGAAGGPDELGIFAADELAREVRNTGRGIVPENIASVANSRDFYVGDKVRVSSLMREARKMNVTVVIIGRIHRIKYRQKGDPVGILRKKKSMAAVEMEMRVFDVSEGKEIYVESKTADGSTSKLNIFTREDADSDTADSRRELVQEAIRSGAVQFAKSMSRVLDKVAWEGRIAKITAPYLYINAGKSSGLSLGDILKVITPGEDIFDPMSGAIMGRSKGQIKGTLEVVDYMGGDGAVAKVHSGAGFSEGDTVQLY